MKRESSLIKSYIAALLSVIVLVCLDQYTKAMAVLHLKDKESFDIIKGVFQLHYLENKGAAFGIMQNKQVMFIIGAVFICLVIALLYGKMPFARRYLPLRICAVLICAGAIGNLIDRICNQYVVDFFYFELIDFPIFNVADIYVVVACFLFAFLILWYYKEEELNCFFPKSGSEK